MSAFECFMVAGVFEIGNAIDRHRAGYLPYSALGDSIISFGFFVAGCVKTVWP